MKGLPIKNRKLFNETFKKIAQHENLALKYYSEGNMKLGKKHEDAADKLYAKHYYDIFEVMKK